MRTDYLADVIEDLKINSDFGCRYKNRVFTHRETKFIFFTITFWQNLSYTNYFKYFPYQDLWNYRIIRHRCPTQIAFLKNISVFDWEHIVNNSDSYIQQCIERFGMVPFVVLMKSLSSLYTLTKILGCKSTEITKEQIEILLRNIPNCFDYMFDVKKLVEYADDKGIVLSQDIYLYLLETMIERCETIYMDIIVTRIVAIPENVIEEMIKVPDDFTRGQRLFQIHILLVHGHLHRYSGRKNLPWIVYRQDPHTYDLFLSTGYPVSFSTRTAVRFDRIVRKRLKRIFRRE